MVPGDNLVEVQLTSTPTGLLRGTFQGKFSVPLVKAVWAAPQSRPGEFLVLLNAKGEEIMLLEKPEMQLSRESLRAVQEEIRRRDLTASVLRVANVRQEYGATYWTVETDRGQREFVTQNLSENSVWFGERRLLIVDVDGNRFEFEDMNRMDDRSRELVESIL